MIQIVLGGAYTENVDGLINLLNQLPAEVKTKLSDYGNFLEGELELIVLYGGDFIITKNGVTSIGGNLEDLGFGFGIITISISKINSLKDVKSILYVELPKTLFTSFIKSNEAACIPEAWQSYNLSGKGVIVGFIDTGIDYLHPAFIDDNGNSRIDYILDLSMGAKVWNNEEINKAIKSTNPYSIVSEQDIAGHGTHVSGIACAGGKIDKRYYGVAYDSRIIMVKMTSEKKANFGKSTQLMRGIKFLIDKAKELNKPLVINLSFSTNDGAHDGSSLLEQYISTVCKLLKISFAIAAGNEGDAAHHVGGVLREKQTISMNVSEDEKVLILQFYKNFLDEVSIEIVNPQAISSGIIKIEQGYKEGNVGKDKYFFYNSGPKPFSINGEIIISLVSNENFLTGGAWKIIIYLKKLNNNVYSIWMPISEGLNKQTKFLQPNVFNTLGIPATVADVISVGSYNYVSNSVSSFSGRGGTSEGTIKPDLCAPGEMIESSIPGGTYDSLSGTSMATPLVAGAAALLMEWGIVNNKDPYMYGDRLKYYLLKGASRDRTDVNYPNPTWGYGTLCLGGALSLASNLRENFRQECMDVYVREDYENFIVEYQGDILKAISGLSYACGIILDEDYAIVSIQQDKVKDFFSTIKEAVYVEESVIYTLCELSPLNTSNILKFHDNTYLTLRGAGVIVGIVDTGIDYLNKEFQYEDESTKIVRLWDQTSMQGQPPQGFSLGTEYNSLKINEAIKAAKGGGNAYSIVNSKDTNGHGTEMAGIIAARGINPEMVGAAPDSELAVVKLKNAKANTLLKQGIGTVECQTYDTTDILLGIKYLHNLARSLNKPMVIYVPVSTNSGAHDGSSIIERFIDDISKTRGIVVVTGCGNQGDSDTHTTGTLQSNGDIKNIEIKVDDNQKDLTIQIWCYKPDKVSVAIVSPSGEVIDKIPAKLQETEEIKFVFEGSSVFLTYFYPEEMTGDELIKIRINNITGGIWQIKLIGDKIINGVYHAWIPQRALLKPNTKFLNPSQYTTLTVPSTSRMVLSSAFYNQNNNTLEGSSGRGYTRDSRVKPDITCGGVNVKTTAVGGGTTVVSGSSVGAAVLAGAVTLMLQWGIVNGKDPTLYSTKIKAYLIRGTSKRPGDVYPNRELGYGILDLNEIFLNIRNLEFDENYRSNNIFIRIPKEILTLLD